MKAKYLIVNADDYGAHTKINEGIREAAKNGIVRHISILTNGYAFNDNEINELKKIKGVSFGLHICLTQFRPITKLEQVQSLISENNSFYISFKKFLFPFFTGKIKLNEIYIEIENQIKALQNYNIKISKLDGHQHIHILPGIWRIISILANKYNIKYIRRPYFNIFKCRNNNSKFFHRLAINILSWYSKKDKSLLSPDNIFGLSDSGFLDFILLKNILENLPYGINEIICHPGYDIDEKNFIFKKEKFNWTIEKNALLNSEIFNIIKNNNIELKNFEDFI
ncbi:MAG TPA: ChbG/HpnK family deacetylase [bacterium]|nr:ChbG/HpnK family deacetylase [bacterium]HOL46611.1 ChbG/HpnK family deacetylase [bacterium]HPQ17818.1 ChbG/HpnK family deacetylase [bacterium]